MDFVERNFDLLAILIIAPFAELANDLFAADNSVDKRILTEILDVFDGYLYIVALRDMLGTYA